MEEEEGEEGEEGEEWKRMKILRPLVVSRKRKVALLRIDLRMGREYRQGRTRREPPSINWMIESKVAMISSEMILCVL